MPGTLSWLDPNNNKAFLDGQISVTNNGISIYYAAKNSTDPKVKEMAADIQHANFPVGPVGVPTESHLFFNQMVIKHTKYPKAAKEFVRFMMEEGAVRPLDAGRRRLHLAAAGGLREEPDLDRRPEEHALPRRGEEHAAPGYAGKLGYASAGALADFIVQEHGGRGGERLQEDAEAGAAPRDSS